jgi:hypothetical protein
MKRMIAIVGMALMSSTASAWQAAVIDNPQYAGEKLVDIALEQRGAKEATVVPAKFEGRAPANSGMARVEENWALRYFQEY